jgi:hypothetical protein
LIHSSPDGDGGAGHERERDVQTLIAYVGSGGDDGRWAAGAAAVQRHYASLAGGPLRHEVAQSAGRGLHVWEAHAGRRRWPMWHQDRDLAVATLHTPLDYESLVGQIPPERAPIPLAQRLLARPDAVLELGGPFVLAALDPAELAVLTDGVGLGRLFELRLPHGWVWSNRPTAAYLFAGLPVGPDRRGWRYHASSDWFMADSSPFEGLTAVAPATCIRVDGDGVRRVDRQDPVRYWLDTPADPLEPDALECVAGSLQRGARSVARLWSEIPRIGLSGGRDSRLVTAAFLSAGVDVQLHTNANPQGEADVAAELVARWGGQVPHEVKQVASIAAPVRDQMGAADRAVGWMRYSEGLHPASFLPRVPPTTHARGSRLLVSGVAGELAHGHYYPPDPAAVAGLPVHEQLKVCAAHLRRRLIARHGPSAEARALVTARIDQVLGAAVEAGAQPLVALDVFYMVERLRRWGTSADMADIAIPLLTPAFVRAALGLTPQQRRENALHRALTAHMVPAWADVPYYAPAPSTGRRGRAPAPRLWQVDAQREVLAAVVHESGIWADAFDVAQVHEIWQKAVVGGASAGEESVLQRVIWRAAFREYCAEVNGEPAVRPAPIAVTAVGSGLSVQTLRLRLARVKGRLRRQPAIRQAANTRLGRRIRRLMP